ncbi:hypothetical protein FRACYDRAFT_267514 [Fragilariopsis cylindrus CCMP1102]|uniref:Uncharacterized protein n=1 Tax=Fragilariopsis cylindrus CCMP1102 TaxID=635003 RepID=A0A1E7FZ32_9STRA|nr:hypothetical protein FRACYDRAFT_267514 [Fragilariopsis cylindrus CCMP1102]|eukprot:OEU23374.1 hypothetical protein FRACYDRAFT_267514 [Fragilariopsis cylindrus CCMP1102]
MASFGTFCVIDLNKSMPRDCRIVPKRRKRRNRRKYQAIVHEDDDEDDEDDNEKELWLEPRVIKVVEDEYSHCDADGDDNDTQMKQVAKKSSSSVKTTAANTQSIIPNEVSDEEITTRNCTIVSHYKNMLYTEFLGPKEMVVVEQPWLDVAETFPAALQRRIYGAD